MRYIFLFIILLISCYSFTQRTAAYDDGSRDIYYPDEVLSVSVSPLALVDPYSGSAYKLGVTFRPIPKIRISADGGGYLPNFTQRITGFDNMNGYHFRTAIGVPSYATNSDIGYGVSYEYKRQDFTYNGRTLTNPTEYTGIVNKFAHSYNGFVSIDLCFGWRFYIELRAEIGLRYREITNSHSLLVEDTEGWAESRYSGRIMNQKQFMPNFGASIRLNYSLWLD